jgi:hypothetical protein
MPGGPLHHRRTLIDHPWADRRVDEGDALGDEPPGAGGARRRDQVGGALRPHPVGRTIGLGSPRVDARWERGQLVDHDIRPRGADRGG